MGGKGRQLKKMEKNKSLILVTRISWKYFTPQFKQLKNKEEPKQTLPHLFPNLSQLASSSY